MRTIYLNRENPFSFLVVTKKEDSESFTKFIELKTNKSTLFEEGHLLYPEGYSSDNVNAIYCIASEDWENKTSQVF